MKKIKKPVSILLAVLMVFSVFAVVPFTASAAEQMETVNLPVPMPENRTVTTDNITVTGQSAGSNGWELDPDTSATLRLINGKTITKIVIYSAASSNGAPLVKVGGNSISFTKSGDAYTFENINADQVYMEGSTYVFITNKIDVYFSDPTYTVTWKNWNGDILETDTDVAEGTTPTYDGGTPPEKAEDEENTYTFSGWTPEVTAVTGDVTYTAQFDATPKAHKHDGITFEKWTSGNSLPTEAGNYVLTSDVTLSDTWTVPEGETNLCLDGYHIYSNGAGNMINVAAGNVLNLYDKSDNSGTLGHSSGVKGGCFYISGGTVNMHGGTITGNDNTTDKNNGGGVTVVAGTFNMFNGVIKANKSRYGGGVSVAGGTFKMENGTIEGNEATLFGGGVSEWDEGTAGKFIFNGGSIIGNKAPNGGGIDVWSTTEINGGMIKDNTTSGNGGGVYVQQNGNCTMTAGNIEGNVANNGAGIAVNAATFTMSGGTIRYNSGYGNTGGVLLVSTDNFTMTGGEIRYNVGKNFGGIGIANAHPNMSGTSVVKDNVVFNDTSATNTKITKNDSGYTIASGGTPCDIKDSTVNGLKINVTGAFENGAQIGIFNNNQTAEFTSGFDANNPGGAPANYFFSNDSNRFVMLSANKEVQLGGYYTVTWKNDDGSVLETDEDVSTGTTPEYNGTEPTKASDGVVTSFEFTGWTPAVSPVTGDVTYTATYNAIMPDHEHGGIVYKGWASKNSLPTEAGNYYLGYDVTLSSTWTVSTNTRLCLNGNGITKNGGGNVIQVVGGGNLTIDDCGTKTHYFDVNNGKAVNVNTTPGENRKSFTGGYITGGTGASFAGGSYFWSDGGGVDVAGGNFTFNGGTILGNSAVFGGGVQIYSGTMTMNGGTVCYNTGNAGISFRTGSSAYNRGGGATTGYFVMNGGLVANNSAGVTTAGYSYNNDYATFNGGKIVDNVNSGIYSQNIKIAGDIEITGNKDGAGFRDTCSISGNPVITGNTNSNLSINNGKTINTGTFGENARIGITMRAPGVFTTGFNENNTLVPTDVFTEDDPIGTKIINSAAGEGELEFIMVTASFNAGVGSGTMDPIEVQKGKSFNLPECTFTAPEGKLFLNWSDGTNTYNPGDSCTMTADTEFTAQWMDGIKVSFKANGGSGDMEDVLSYPDYKLPACGFTAPEGKFFVGWRSSADNQVYQTGDTVTLTAETQFKAQWGAEVKYQFDFEDGLPDGWQTSNNLWYLNANGGDSKQFPAHSGQKNMTYYKGSYNDTYSELRTSSFDMTNAESATLGFWYTNRNWGSDTDQLSVSYRVGDGAWEQLFTTNGAHGGWTKAEITLPPEAFGENVRFRFGANGHWGYGIALDDVELNITGSKDLIAGHSLSLDGNIGINFYLDPTAAGLTVGQVTADNLEYSFEWADGNALVEVSKQAEEKKFSIDTKDGVDYIKVTCHVCAAEMTCGVNVSFTIGGKTQTETYSVRQYADEILSDSNSPEKLKNLTKAMLNYGAKAQTKFRIKSEDPKDLADYKVNYTMEDVTGTMIDTAVEKENGRATSVNLQAVASANGAKWYTTSLVYLDDNTLRLYFVKETDAFKPSDYTANKGNYYYVEVSGIQAKNLDKWQTFKVGDQEFQYSALDFAKLMIYSRSDDASKNLAKALYWYNQAANDYFDD